MLAAEDEGASHVAWRRGFFRLWVLGSVLFAVVVAALSYAPIRVALHLAAFEKAWKPDTLMVPVRCDNARGAAGADYATREGRKPGPWDQYSKSNASDYCWYLISKFRELYPEYKRISDVELASKKWADAPPPPPGFEVNPQSRSAALGGWAPYAPPQQMAVDPWGSFYAQRHLHSAFPLRLLLLALLSGGFFPALKRGHLEDQLRTIGNGPAVLRAPNLGVRAEVADQDHLVDATSHEVTPLGFDVSRRCP
jgi:hypothetical protein